MKLRQAAAAATWVLSAYRGTTVLLVATGTMGLVAALPVMALMAPHGFGVAPAVALPTMPSADLALFWSAFAQSPSNLQRAAVGALLGLLFGVAIGVLVVTWITTLSVSTARADARATEIAVRRAVGASRGTLFATALLEGGGIAALALVAGAGGGLVAARLALAAWPGTAESPAVTLTVLAIGTTLGAILLGALFPLIFARRSSQITVPESSPVGLAIPAIQLGLSLTALATAAMLNHGAARLTTPTSGASASGEVYEITPPDSKPAARAAAYGALLQRLHRSAGVAVASLSSPGALTGLGEADFLWSQFSDCAPGFRALPLKGCWANYESVSADSFNALGLRLLAGRALADRDDWQAPRVAVISRSLAFPLRPQDVVGLTLRIGHGLPTPYTVVGVVDDRQPAGIGGSFVPRFAVYLSVLQHPAAPVDLLVRTRGNPAAVGTNVMQAIAAGFDPPATRIVRSSEARLLEADVAPLRWFGWLFTVEGWAVLAVATIGTFAMMWLWVASLSGEIGVRRAVGARRRRLMLYVLARALAVAAGGVAFGSWLGMMVWDAAAGIVSGLPAWEPSSVARLGLVLAIAAVAGAWLPAYRTTHAPLARLLTS